MPFFLADFVQKYPGMDLSMDVTNKRRVIESLEQNKVDFSLVSVLPAKMNIAHMGILPNKLFLIGKSGATDEHKNVFAEVPMIFRESGSATREAMEKFINEHHIDVPKKLELTTNEAVKQAIIAGIGYSIMPIIGLKNELQAGQIRIIPIRGLPLQTSWSLIWLKDKKHSPVAEAYLKYLEAEREKIATQHFDWIGQYG
jgi:DNA-binding transcriptional LysR family regulator